MNWSIALLGALTALCGVGAGLSTYSTYRAYAHGGLSAHDPLFWIGAAIVATTGWSMIWIGRRLLLKVDADRDKPGGSS